MPNWPRSAADKCGVGYGWKGKTKLQGGLLFFKASGVANAMRRVPHKHFIARGNIDAVLDEAPHVRVLGVEPLLKTESEDWNEDGVLIVDGLGDATCWLVFVAHSAAA